MMHIVAFIVSVKVAVRVTKVVWLNFALADQELMTERLETTFKRQDAQRYNTAFCSYSASFASINVVHENHEQDPCVCTTAPKHACFRRAHVF